MSELLAVPVKEYPQFEAALSLMPVLHPDQVLTLLRGRVTALHEAISEVRATLQAASNAGLPRLFLIEGEYHLAMQEAELAWVRDLVAQFGDGAFPGLDLWRHWHETGARPEIELDFSGGAADHATPTEGDKTTG